MIKKFFDFMKTEIPVVLATEVSYWSSNDGGLRQAVPP
jgi:hypothetical protein